VPGYATQRPNVHFQEKDTVILLVPLQPMGSNDSEAEFDASNGM